MEHGMMTLIESVNMQNFFMQKLRSRFWMNAMEGEKERE